MTRKKPHEFPEGVSVDRAITPQLRFDADHRAGMDTRTCPSPWTNSFSPTPERSTV
jgi:hypothetical protein